MHRPGAARRGRRADLPADRQRADRHHGPRRGDPGAAPGDGRAGQALRLQGGDVRAVRPRVQGRGRGDGEDRQGGPGAVGCEPAAGLRQLHRARGGLPGVLRAGQRPGAPGERRGPGGRGWPPSGRCCTRCRPSRTRWRWARSGWSATTRRSGSGRSATPPRPATPGTRVWCRVAGDGTGDHRPDRPRRGRDRPAPAVGPGQPADPGRALPAPPGRERAAPAPATAADRSRGSVPGHRRRRAAVAGRGRRVRRGPDPVEDGPRGRARRRGRRRQGRTRRSAWRRSPAGSPTATWPRSSTTWPPSAPPARS